MNPQTDLKQERRKQILDAAEKVFTKRGLDKARMDDIVHESGLSKGALYWYFKSKDAIIRALLDRVFINEMRGAEELIHTQGSSSERLRTFVANAVQEYKRFENMLPLAYEFVALAARSKVIREAIVGYFKRYTAILAEIIQQGIESGEFQPCDPERTAISVIAMYEGMAMLWFIERDLVDWDRMGAAPLETILAGLTVEKS
ncbi:MAG: TetR/AcrR family transcriptional regulator [Anaerolineales bacterium]|nr:TetR/AcrR family transcriptional regulator [Anaerolineales bacterium]